MMLILHQHSLYFKVNLGQRKNMQNKDALFLGTEVVVFSVLLENQAKMGSYELNQKLTRGCVATHVCNKLILIMFIFHARIVFSGNFVRFMNNTVSLVRL
jgi:hypothetical protein